MPPGLMARRQIDPPVLTYVTGAASGSNTNQYTFAGLSIGTEAADRLVVVVVSACDDSANAGEAPTGITCNGVAMDIHVSAAGTGANESSVAIATLLVPTGTTATFVVTYPDNRTRAGIAVFTLTGYNSATPAATASTTADATTSASLAMNVGAKQVGLVVSAASTTSNLSCSWSHGTEQFDTFLESGGVGNHSGTLLAPGSGSASVQGTWSGACDISMVGVVWSAGVSTPPEGPSALHVTDDFNRSDGGLGSDWTTYNGSPVISDNKFSGGSGNNGAYWSGGSFANDQYAEATIGDTTTTSGHYYGVGVRMGATQGYVWWYENYSGGKVQLWKSDGSGGWTVVGSTTTGVGSLVAGDALRAEVEGDTHRLYINDVLVATRTDSSFLTGGAPGLDCTNTATLDNFAGGDFPPP